MRMKKSVTAGVAVLLITAMFLTLLITSCGVNEEAGPRDVTERFFTAVKAGDNNGAIECFTPAMQQQLSAWMSIGGLFSKELTGIDSSPFALGVASSFNQEAYENCEFIVDRVEFTDDTHEHATVYVKVDGASEGMPDSTSVETILYDGEWYIEK